MAAVRRNGPRPTGSTSRRKPAHGCVLVASFHTAAEQVNIIAEQFRASGLIDVIWPKPHLRFIDRGQDFPRDVMDPPEASSKQLEQRVLAQGIDSKRCCFVYLVNPYHSSEAYFGLDTAYELGWAGRAGKRVYTFERIMTAPVIAHQVEGVKTPEEMIKMVAQGRCPCGRKVRKRKEPAAV